MDQPADIRRGRRILAGPLESAATLAVGKVFDIYKCVALDPFFLEVHHFGTNYAARNPPPGRRYGEPPLLAIAQGATRALNGSSTQQQTPNVDRLMQAWIEQGSAGETVARLVRESFDLSVRVSSLTELTQAQEAAIAAGIGEVGSLTAQSASLKHEAKSLNGRIDQLTREGDGLREQVTALTREGAALREQVTALARDSALHHHSLRWMAHALFNETALRLRRRLGRSG